jgi:hypothetical protein
MTRDLRSRRAETTFLGPLLSKRLNGGFRLDVVSTREKLVEVVLIPRERARSALGYIQSSAKISSEDMPSS